MNEKTSFTLILSIGNQWFEVSLKIEKVNDNNIKKTIKKDDNNLVLKDLLFLSDILLIEIFDLWCFLSNILYLTKPSYSMIKF